MGFVCFPCSECVPQEYFILREDSCPSALNPTDGMWGLRASKVVQGRDSGAVGSSRHCTPTHIRSIFPSLSLALRGCNRDAGSLGACFGGSGLLGVWCFWVRA